MKNGIGIVVASIFALAYPISASAETSKFAAELSGKNEAPANDSKASGMVTADYDTVSNKLTWSVKVSGLSGSPTRVHFHGPAKEGENANPLITLEAADVASEKIDGSAILTTEQVNALKDGKVYLNVHTAKFPDGEVRGQLKAK